MKKNIQFVLLIWGLFFCLTVTAQTDNRQRTVETVIADGLAQLPAPSSQVFNQVIGEMAATGQQGMEMLAAMLKPAAQSDNAAFEYAIDGIVSYVSAPGREAMRNAIRSALKQGIDKCTDNANKAFLMLQLQKVSTAEDAAFFEKYLNDAYLHDFALRGIKSGSEGAGDFAALSSAAKALKYHPDKAGTVDAYLQALEGLGDVKAILKEAKTLVKSDVPAIRCAGLRLLLKHDSKAVEANILKALKDKDIQYRNTALALAPLYAGDGIFAEIASKCAKMSIASQCDIVRWLGNHHAESQVDVVLAAMDEGDAELAVAAIEAAGRIGGEKALHALVGMLGGAHAAEAEQALLAFRGNVNDAAIAALGSSSTAVQKSALNLVSTRRISEAYDKVLKLTESQDASLQTAAYAALEGVVRTENLATLCALMEQANPADAQALQQAACAAIATETPEKQYALIASHFSQSAKQPLYYPLLAQVGNEQAINLLQTEYKQAAKKSAALEALQQVDNPLMLDVLYQLAQDAGNPKDALLKRYLVLLPSSSASPSEKYQLCRRALELNPSDEVKSRLVAALSQSNTYPALMLAGRYLDDEATAFSAATVVKDMVASQAELRGGAGVKELLTKASSVFQAAKEKGDADAGYSIDQIAGLLLKLEPIPTYELSAEEKKAGFELLFDGHSLDKWQGNKDSYVPIDGNIYVTAQYGGEGNLYTNKTYSDFVFRFEFCFETPGVNNGIGVRTKIGTDAAYEGMEIQILDHDDPIYAGLQPYQQHGSVYGIIVPKHVKFGELGTWNTEEIRVVGDNIKVTVNGEVILQGNIRKACKGHHVAPDGSDYNPYTVDHRNHPGLFNKEGYISFCGHGSGVKFRHVRVLDLSKK